MESINYLIFVSQFRHGGRLETQMSDRHGLVSGLPSTRSEYTETAAGLIDENVISTDEMVTQEKKYEKRAEGKQEVIKKKKLIFHFNIKTKPKNGARSR